MLSGFIGLPGRHTSNAREFRFPSVGRELHPERPQRQQRDPQLFGPARHCECRWTGDGRSTCRGRASSIDISVSSSYTSNISLLECFIRTSENFVRKKAALTLLRLYRKHPDVIPAKEWALRIVSIMDDPDLVSLFNVTSVP